jgi:hypothetical protein
MTNIHIERCQLYFQFSSNRVIHVLYVFADGRNSLEHITMSWLRVRLRGNTINIVSVDVDVLMCLDCIHNGLIDNMLLELVNGVCFVVQPMLVGFGNSNASFGVLIFFKNFQDLFYGYQEVLKPCHSKISLVYSKIYIKWFVFVPLVVHQCDP